MSQNKEIFFEECVGYRVIPCYNVIKLDHDTLEVNGVSEILIASFTSEEEAASFITGSNDPYCKIVPTQVIEIDLNEVYEGDRKRRTKNVYFNFAGKNRLIGKTRHEQIEREVALSKLTDREKKLLGISNE